MDLLKTYSDYLKKNMDNPIPILEFIIHNSSEAINPPAKMGYLKYPCTLLNCGLYIKLNTFG